VGLYNIVHATVVCPRCDRAAQVEIETKLGYMGEMCELRVGDQYPWAPSWASISDGGRPKDGTAIGDGYAECPLCARDFFLHVFVDGDVITRVEVDAHREGHVPD
jgi:hypothetical protein